MSDEKRGYFLYIDGQAVPVSEQVYRAYWHYTEKETYFTGRLKGETFVCDQETQTAAFIPSREDSLDRLLEIDQQFAAEQQTTEEQAIASVWLQELMQGLSDEERQIIYQLYVLDRTEREAYAALRLARTTFQSRKYALLEKLRNLLNENF